MAISYKTISLFPPVSWDNDATLLDAAKQMDRESLVRIFDTYAPALYNYAYRLCNDALMADNIVGDVFAKLLDHLSAGRGPSTNLRSYLYEIAYHLVVDEARFANRSAPLDAADLLPQNANSMHLSVEDRAMFKIMEQAIRNNLSEDQRHVIILRFLEGFSVKETALIVGKSISNVKVIQNRAIAALRKALGTKGAT
ncbi:MAG: RNA polymerase sigma factor [Bacteroidota bacterium]